MGEMCLLLRIDAALAPPQSDSRCEMPSTVECSVERRKVPGMNKFKNIYDATNPVAPYTVIEAANGKNISHHKSYVEARTAMRQLEPATEAPARSRPSAAGRATQSSLTPLEAGDALHREQISKLSHGVDNMLTLYLEVHDGIFATSWWRSIPIPGVFKRIPFDQYEPKISKVEKILREIESHVRALYREATGKEKTYLTVFHQYTAALLKTVIALNPVVAGLRRKMDGKPYDILTYYRDLAVYWSTESGYHALGEEMNRQWRAYSRS
jgi:hypothetical protein